MSQQTIVDSASEKCMRIANTLYTNSWYRNSKAPCVPFEQQSLEVRYWWVRIANDAIYYCDDKAF